METSLYKMIPDRVTTIFSRIGILLRARIRTRRMLSALHLLHLCPELFQLLPNPVPTPVHRQHGEIPGLLQLPIQDRGRRHHDPPAEVIRLDRVDHGLPPGGGHEDDDRSPRRIPSWTSARKAWRRASPSDETGRSRVITERERQTRFGMPRGEVVFGSPPSRNFV